LVISYIYKDAWSLAQAKGQPSLIYHEPVLEVRFVRGAAGTMRILTIRGCDWKRNFRVAVTREQSGANLQIFERECRVRIFPGCLKFSSNLLSGIVLLLGFQSIQKAKQRAGISGILF